jgi:hypothetical protein
MAGTRTLDRRTARTVGRTSARSPAHQRRQPRAGPGSRYPVMPCLQVSRSAPCGPGVSAPPWGWDHVRAVPLSTSPYRDDHAACVKRLKTKGACVRIRGSGVCAGRRGNAVLSYPHPSLGMNHWRPCCARHQIPTARRRAAQAPHGVPASRGTTHTVRSLAAVTGLSYSKIQKLITEERPTTTGSEADRIACAVQCRRRALFSPSSSPSWDGDQETETPDEPR